MIFIHIVNFNGLQTVKGQNCCFGAASKGYKRYQTMNNDLIYYNFQKNYRVAQFMQQMLLYCKVLF